MTLDTAEPRRSLYEAALDALERPVLIHDRDTILYANPATRGILHAGETPLVGRSITDIVHPDGRAAGDQRRGLVLDSGQQLDRLPVKLRALDGATLYVLVDARPIEWTEGRAVLLLGTVVDSQ